MKKIVYFLGTVLIISVILFSCEKETSLQQNNFERLELRSKNNNLDESLKKVATLFSRYYNDRDFKSMILDAYNEGCIEEFTLFDLLKYKKSNYKIYDLLDSLAMINPILTIAYPSYAFHENETFEEHLSSIDYTVILIDDPDDVKTLPAYNSAGELVEISSEFNENINYCVIKYSESEIAVNNKTKKTIFGENVVSEVFDIAPIKLIGDYNIYKPADVINAKFKNEGRFYSNESVKENELKDCDYFIIDSEDGGNTGGGDPVDPRTDCDEPCDRDCTPKTKDELHRVKWSSKDAVKKFESGWHLPRVEMIAYYAIPRFNGSHVTSVDLRVVDVFIKWRQMTGTWSVALGNEIATWTPDLGDRWQVTWLERDYWNKVTEQLSFGFTVGFKIDNVDVKANAKYLITIMKKDKIMGNSLIEYCDPAFGEGYTYKPYSFVEDNGTSGGFWFKEHIRNK